MLIRLAALAAVLLLGCQATAPPDYQHIKIDTGDALQAASVGEGDVFEIRVHGHKDLSGIHRVSPAGTIDFPLIGRVAVAGKRPSAITDIIAEKLRDGYLRHPSVTIYVKEFNSKKVFVLGQVKKPGAFNFEDRMSIVQAIAVAGGFTPVAQKNYAIVKRVTDGAEKRIPVPVEKIITDEKSRNFVLQPGDIVFVPEAVL